jgi:hypothetical protein
MNDTRKGLTIHFTDGSSVSFDFPIQPGDPAAITRRVEELLKDQYIMIEAEGALLLYPLANVRSLQVFPAPDTLPQNCIKGASISN